MKVDGRIVSVLVLGFLAFSVLRATNRLDMIGLPPEQQGAFYPGGVLTYTVYTTSSGVPMVSMYYVSETATAASLTTLWTLTSTSGGGASYGVNLGWSNVVWIVFFVLAGYWLLKDLAS